MLRNYFKIAFRSLRRNKAFSAINLFGLTVGITCCLLIALYITDELAYDRHHEKADHIYRVTRNFISNEGTVTLHLGHVSPPFGPLLKNDFPEIEQVVRLLQSQITLRQDDKIFTEEQAFFAEDNIFDVFSINVKNGNPKQTLMHPYSVMLTPAMAVKYFGTEDVMNRELTLGGGLPLKITGLFEPFPAQSHFHPDFLISFRTLNDTTLYGEENLRTNWSNNSFSTFLLLPEKYDPAKLTARFPAFIDKHLRQEENTNQASRYTTLFLDKLTDIHLHSHLDSEIEDNGDINRVYIFSVVALFIMLIACINYMNLATAQSVSRSKEIGVRKVMGSGRRELVLQFLSESVLLTLLAVSLAFVFTWLGLPVLNSLTGKNFAFHSLLNGYVLGSLPVAALLVGLLAGLYPALFMSSFQPIRVLKGTFRVGGAAIPLRQLLVVAQFGISIMLICSTGIVFQQLRYMQQKSLGFDKDHVVTLPYYDRNLTAQYEAFRNELLHNSAIRNVARSKLIPSQRLLDSYGAATVQLRDSLAPSPVALKTMPVDHDFIDTYQIELLAGRNFSREYSTDDTTAFIINEAALKAFGWKTAQEAVGRQFNYAGRNGYLIGVLKDFHFESMHEEIVPVVLLVPRRTQTYHNLSVKVSGSDLPGTLDMLEKTWAKFVPDYPFSYTFLDDDFAQLYLAEQRQSRLFTLFSGIAILIACLGLFGLAAFVTAQRTKEIGIRKVLGASVGQIVALLSGDFLRLVLIAFVIATPVAAYAMHRWLQDFAYRIDLPWWIFAAAGIIALLIALITVSFQAIKAARVNPVKSLRSE